MSWFAPSMVPALPIEDLEHVLNHTCGLWEELRGQRIFLTGGTGFFGLWLLESFVHANERLSLGARATVLTRSPAAFALRAPHLAGRPELEFVQGDVRNFVFPEGEFPFIIHAGTTSSAPVEPREMFDTIVTGTRRVLEFAASRGTRKLLFVSSGAVYGRPPPEMTHIPEDYLGALDFSEPAVAYAEGKRAAEMLCTLNACNDGYEAKIARGFAFVGPHLPLDAHFAIGNFIRDARHGGPIQVQGDGTPFRSFLYAADLAVWLWTILLRGQGSRAYNVGSPQAVSITEVAHTVRDASGGEVTVTVARPRRAGAPLRYVPDTTRAEQELGLKPQIDLGEAVRRTMHWHSANLNASHPSC